MRLSVFNENDRVLLLGEGNFSFSRSLCKHNLKIMITSTCYEPSAISEEAEKNLEFLRAEGVSVYFGVDATKLADHPALKSKSFHKIIFNFPHCCSKMRLDKNRNLLRSFFASAGEFLESEGQILVTLCNGQGGTLHDKPRRAFGDSWKIREMAAYSNFLLTAVEKFQINLFTDYNVTGYRGLDKQFHTTEALTHFFTNVPEPVPSDFRPNLNLNSEIYNCEVAKWSEVTENEGFNVERLCPPYFAFDITFTIPQRFSEARFFVVLYKSFGRVVKNVEFVKFYEFPGSSRITRTYRLLYHSDQLPLHRERALEIHKNFANFLEEKLDVIVSR